MKTKKKTVRKKKKNPKGIVVHPTQALGDVTYIRYIRKGEPKTEYEHRFETFPKAKYDPKKEVLVLFGVYAEPV